MFCDIIFPVSGSVKSTNQFVYQDYGRHRFGNRSYLAVALLAGLGLGETVSNGVEYYHQPSSGPEVINMHKVEPQPIPLEGHLALDAIFMSIFGLPTYLGLKASDKLNKRLKPDLLIEGYSKLMGRLLIGIKTNSNHVELTFLKGNKKSVDYESVIKTLKEFFLDKKLLQDKAKLERIYDDLKQLAMLSGRYPERTGAKAFLDLIKGLPDQIKGNPTLQGTLKRAGAYHSNIMAFLALKAIESLSFKSISTGAPNQLPLNSAEVTHSRSISENSRSQALKGAFAEYVVEFRRITDNSCEFKTYRKLDTKAQPLPNNLVQELFPALNRPDLGIQSLDDGWYRIPNHIQWQTLFSDASEEFRPQ